MSTRAKGRHRDAPSRLGDALIVGAMALVLVGLGGIVWLSQVAVASAGDVATARSDLNVGGSTPGPMSQSTVGPPTAAPVTVSRGSGSRATTKPKVRATKVRTPGVLPGRTFQAKPVPVEISSTFRVATLNVLGSQHTAGPGGLGPGVDRAAREAQLLIDRGAEVIGLQEVQVDQLHVFVNQMPGYTVWPQETLGRNAYRLQLAFRTDRFEMVEGGQVDYVFDGKHIPLPYALLRDRATGAETWVAVTHNSPGGMQREREISTAIEAQLLAGLATPERPMLLLGDMNEHTEVVCRVGRTVPVITANGASASGSGCYGPAGPVRIDWIIGTTSVDFEGYVQDAAPRLSGMSDHYLIAATATVSHTVLQVPGKRR